MSHIVLKWNPSRWSWPDLETRLAEVAETGATIGMWDCSTAKKVAAGDRVLLLRVGRRPKGIIGIATVTRPPFEDKHWEPERAAMGDRRRYVELEFDHLAREPFIPDEELTAPPFDAINWFTQTPVIYIPDEVLAAVESRVQSSGGG